MSTTQVTTPDDAIVAANQKKASYFLSLVSSMDVKTPEDFALASEEIRKLKTTAKAMDDDRLTFTGPLNAILKRINERFQPHIKLLEQAECILKDKMSAFQRAEQQRVDAERRAAEATASEQRRKLEAEATERRRAAEAEANAARRAEEERQAAARREQARIEAEAAAARGKKAKAEAEERARVSREQEAQRQAEANREAAARRERAEAEAQALEQTAAVVTAQPVAQVARIDGISAVKGVDYEVTDKAEFIRFALEKRPDLLDLWEPDPTKMRALVKLQGMATSMPGLRVFPKIGITVR